MTKDGTLPLAVFRVDASPAIGGGHVMRCLALADALSERGWRCAFACNEETLSVIPSLAASSHETNEPENLTSAWPVGCDLLVVDHYGLDETFESACRPWARRILAIDDLADRNHDCDVLLDQTYGRRPEDYEGLVPGYCLILTGAAYALLRPQFARARHQALFRRTKRPAERVLVSLGATDPGKVADKVLDGIESCEIFLATDVVGGEKRSLSEATFHPFVEDMAELMSAADFAIGAGGTSAWERCCLGLPSILLTTADNQRLVVRNLTDAGAALAVGDAIDVTPDQIADVVMALVSDVDLRHTMSRAAASACDGLGTARTIMAVAPAMTANGRPVRLAPASMDHGEIMYEWQTTPGIRQNFNNPEAPVRDRHFQWLEQRLSDPACIFNMVLCDEKPSGIIRLEHKPESDSKFDSFEVSILIAPERQGMGLGKNALNQAREMLPDARLVATILSDNDASECLFLSAGYSPVGDGIYWNEPR